MSKPETAPQTLTGLIRSRVATYQARQLAGVTQKTFAEELTAEGHPISYADFRTLYSRARRQLAALSTPYPAQPQKEATNQEVTPTKTTNNKVDEPEEAVSHRPTDLDSVDTQEVDLRSLGKLARRNKR